MLATQGTKMEILDKVISALYRDEALASCREDADLMVLGHSVPRGEKPSFN